MPAGMAEGKGNSGRGGTLGRNTNRVNLSSDFQVAMGARRTLRLASIGLEVVGRKSTEFDFGSGFFREFQGWRRERMGRRS